MNEITVTIQHDPHSSITFGIDEVELPIIYAGVPDDEVDSYVEDIEQAMDLLDLEFEIVVRKFD